MTTDLIQRLRVFIAVIVLAIAAGAVIDSRGTALFAEEAPAVCQFDDGSDEWACVDLPHDYMNSCEGNDCYTSMEWCCLIIDW